MLPEGEAILDLSIDSLTDGCSCIVHVNHHKYMNFEHGHIKSYIEKSNRHRHSLD